MAPISKMQQQRGTFQYRNAYYQTLRDNVKVVVLEAVLRKKDEQIRNLTAEIEARTAAPTPSNDDRAKQSEEPKRSGSPRGGRVVKVSLVTGQG